MNNKKYLEVINIQCFKQFYSSSTKERLWMLGTVVVTKPAETILYFDHFCPLPLLEILITTLAHLQIVQVWVVQETGPIYVLYVGIEGKVTYKELMAWEVMEVTKKSHCLTTFLKARNGEKPEMMF